MLERGYNWWMWLLALLLPGALLGFGITGLVRTARRWGRSEEAIAASTGLVDLLDPSRRPPAGAGVMPGVPACDDLVNSPGTVLRYRLPIESADTWTLFGLGLFAVLWNAVLAVLAVGAGLDLAGGRIDWLLLVLLVPFAAIGCTGIVLFVHSSFSPPRSARRRSRSPTIPCGPADATTCCSRSPAREPCTTWD